MRFVLGLIVLAYIAFGILYATRTPHWQAPDEPAHFNYVRHVAETGSFPVLMAGDYDQAYLERIKSEKFPPSASIDAIRYESHQPPLYYSLAAPVYLAARAANVDPVLTLRLLSVSLGAVLLLLAFQIFMLVFQANHPLAFAATGLVATVPMHIAMTAAVNNDALAEVVLASLVLISLLRARGDLSDRPFVILAGIGYGLALLTKTTIYVNGAAVLVLGQLACVVTSKRPASLLRPLVPLFGLAFVVSAAWFVRNALTYGLSDPMGLGRHDAIVTGQPTTADWVARYGFKNIFADFFIISFKSFWAQFGWMGVLVNDRIYVALFLLTALASFGAALWMLRIVRERQTQSRTSLWTWIILGASVVFTLAAHAWYNLKFVQPQGRYLFPALVPLAAFWTTGIYELFDARYARLIFLLLYLALLGLDYISLFWFIVPQLTRG